VAALDLRGEVEALDPDALDFVQQRTAAIRARVEAESLPAEIEAAIRTALAELAPNGEPVAVRSSATTEDAEDASFAGLQDTYLWVIGADAVIDRVRACWASLYSVESVCYRRRQGLPESGVAMGVVVQRMVDARCAGVMFTRSPTTGDRSVITIEGAWGLGSAVVSGEVTPDRWVVGKLTGEIPVRDISDKHIRQVPLPGGGIHDEAVPEDLRRAPCLSDAELLVLRDVARKAERHYGRPQDIEWAIEHGTGALLLLQSRPGPRRTPPPPRNPKPIRSTTCWACSEGASEPHSCRNRRTGPPARWIAVQRDGAGNGRLSPEDAAWWQGRAA